MMNKDKAVADNGVNDNGILNHEKRIDNAAEGLKWRPSITENTMNIRNEFLDSRLHEILMDDIRLFHVNHKIKRARIYNSDCDYPHIQMHFMLKGANSAKSYRSGKTYLMGDLQHNIVYIPHQDVDYKVESENAEMLGIQLTENYFKQFVDEDSEVLNLFWQKVVMGRESVLCSERNFNITPRISAITADIMNINKTGHLKKLFLSSKILELLMLQLEAAELEGSSLIVMKQSDREKLFFVRELLEKNILEDFTLRKLSQEAALNEFKLKKGFKELFGKTVFGYFNGLRMDYARDLMLYEKKTVGEVSFILGYSAPHHFSVAFRKRFGILPGSLR